MKNRLLALLLVLMPLAVLAMEPEYRESSKQSEMAKKVHEGPSPFDWLPDEIKLHILSFLGDVFTCREAINNIKAIARTNKDFAKLMADEVFTDQLISTLTARFPYETYQEKWLTAILLNTPTSEKWLKKNATQNVTFSVVLQDPSRLLFFLSNTPTLGIAINNIKDIAFTNKDFASFMANEAFIDKLIDTFTVLFHEETYGEQWITALLLNTPAAKEWLEKNAPNWREWAKIKVTTNLDPAKIDAMSFANDHEKQRYINFQAVKNMNSDTFDVRLLPIVSVSMQDPELRTFLATFRPYGYGSPSTMLHIAAYHGKSTLVKKLLQAGAKVNQGTVLMEITPLSLATEFQHEDTVKTLIQWPGIDLNRIGTGGHNTWFTPLDWAYYSFNEVQHDKKAKDKAERIIKLLRDAGAKTRGEILDEESLAQPTEESRCVMQ